MAVNNWLGTATKIKDITTITIVGPVLIGEHWTVTVGNKSVTITGQTTTTGVCTALQTALTATPQVAEFQEATWVASNPTIIATATNSLIGVPITITASTDSAGGSITPVKTQAATGPWHLDNVANWSTGSVPATSDTINFGAAENGPKYALTALSAVATTNVTVSPSCNYPIGLPVFNSSGYIEYRAKYLQLDGATTFYCNNSNSSLLNFDFLTAAFSGQVDATGSSSLNSNAPVMNLLGSGTTNSLEVNNGSVGVAWFAGETATIKTFQQSGGNVTFGAGCTLNGSGATTTLRSGTMTANSALLTVVTGTGKGTINGTGAITTLTVSPGGSWVQNSTGTVATENLYGSLDLSQDARGKTTTNLNLYPGASITRMDLLTVGTATTIEATVRNISCS